MRQLIKIENEYKILKIDYGYICGCKCFYIFCKDKNTDEITEGFATYTKEKVW